MNPRTTSRTERNAIKRVRYKPPSDAISSAPPTFVTPKQAALESLNNDTMTLPSATTPIVTSVGKTFLAMFCNL